MNWWLTGLLACTGLWGCDGNGGESADAGTDGTVGAGGAGGDGAGGGAGAGGAGGAGEGGDSTGGAGGGSAGGGGAGGRPECVPSCAGRSCGSDSCGGICGTCVEGSVCADGVCSMVGCPPGQLDCNGVCRDLLTDAAHCGSCDNTCPVKAGALTQCIAAECFLSCPGMDGEPRSIDFDRDVENCGQCGTVCPDIQDGRRACRDGVCVSPCDDDESICDNRCINLQHHPWHCGACGVRCGEGSECDDGRCRCRERGLRYCADGCFDLETAGEHCGACGNSCVDGTFCVAGACQEQFGTLTEPGGRVQPLISGAPVEFEGRLHDFDDIVYRLELTAIVDLDLDLPCDGDPEIGIDEVGGRRGILYEGDHYRHDGYRLSRCPYIAPVGLRPGLYDIRVGRNSVERQGGEYTLRATVSSFGRAVPENGVGGDIRLAMEPLAANETIRVPFRVRGRTQIRMRTDDGFLVGECPGDTVLTVYDADGEEVAAADDGWRRPCTGLERVFDGGEYEVEVSGFRGAAIGAYMLTFDYR